MYIGRHTCDVHATCTWYLYGWSIATTYIPVIYIWFKSMSHKKILIVHTKLCRVPWSYYLIVLLPHFLVKRCYVCTYNLCVCGGVMPLSDYLILLLLHFLVKRCSLCVCACVCVCVYIWFVHTRFAFLFRVVSLWYCLIVCSNVVVKSVCTL